MRIAVCDADEIFLLQLKKEIYRYAEKNRFEIVVESFVCGEGILKSEYNYHLIFLGYHLKDINGLETAMTFRNKGMNTPIIFIILSYFDLVFKLFILNNYIYVRYILSKYHFFLCCNKR